MSELGTEQNPLHVAIIGSGPSGFYATEALIKSETSVKIDMFERLPCPYGLVRSGVAPDHPKLKQTIFLYDKIAQSDEFNLIANITVGKDITVEELKSAYHAVVFTCGAETDRKLGIPGEDLPDSHTATEFVGWYNGHPDYRNREFDLSHEVAVIIGQGNVAADVILSMHDTHMLPTFTYACTYHPTYVRMYLAYIKEMGLTITDKQLMGNYKRWIGDAVELNRGEILLLA